MRGNLTIGTHALLLALLASCATADRVTTKSVPELRPGMPAGYLSTEARIDSLALLPPPPTADSPAFVLDQDSARHAAALRDTPRWQIATADANLRFPAAAQAFSCALGAPITEEDTPTLLMLMRRSMVDAGLSTYGAKDQYKRQRPFIANKTPTCTPGEEAMLSKDGSYPSGHSAAGWAWALILAEISPDRANQIFARGRAFGQSRVVCNVHWQSDVSEGRIVGAATVARLHADTAFRADLAVAKQEFAALRARGAKPVTDCDVEKRELAKP